MKSPEQKWTSRFTKIFFLLMALALLFCCTKGKEKTGNTLEEEARWTGLYSTKSGLRSVIMQKEGVYNLLIYQGQTPNSTYELNPAIGYLVSLGYNVITTETGASAGKTEASPEEYMTHINYALDRPGYRNRIVMVYGSALAYTLMAASKHLDRISGWIIIDPDGIPKNTLNSQELRDIAQTMRKSVPVLWVSTEMRRNLETEPKLKDLFASDIQIYAWEPIPKTEEKIAPAFPAKILTNDSFTNYLLLQKYRLSWKSAEQVFPNGCWTKSGQKERLIPRGFQVSGASEADFCPLFMLTNQQGELYRAEDVEDDHCIYRQSNHSKILYCN